MKLDQSELWREHLAAQDSLPQCFERVAAIYPAHVALGSETWKPTYAELNTAANRAAHTLLHVGLAPGDRVVFLMQHDTPLIGAILSVFKAGGIAVVLNPTDPAVRLRQLAEDAGPKMVLTDSANRPLAMEAFGPICTVMNFDHQAVEGSDRNPGIWASPDDTAMLCYTSGSTGQPKALMMNHRLIIHNAARISQAMRLTADDRVASLAALSAYSAFNTAWSALENGASVWLFAAVQRGVTGLPEWIADRDITIYVSSASLFRHFMATLPASASLPQIRAVRLTAETATSEDFKAFQQHFSDSCLFIHTLASSEAGQIARILLKRSDVVAEGRLPIGHPPDGVEVLLLDEAGLPVPDGEVGEIVVRSRYIFSGYWRNEALTQERLSDDPAGNGLRLFRSGDFGRRGADGMLEFYGRSDAMLKIRGYRIELSEVESVIRGLPGIADVIVRPQRGPDHEPQLVAYIVLRNGHSSSATEIRSTLRAVLPRHMIPSAFVFLDQFPQTPYGKIDLSQLQSVRQPDRDLAADTVPGTETEKLLATLWSAEFKRPRIGRDDDFFDLGGDSLVATVIAARLYSALGVELDIGVFLDYSKLSALAARIDAMRGEQGIGSSAPLVQVARDQDLPASYYQERVWNASQTPGGGGLSGAYSNRIVGPLDRDVLHECMNYLAHRHESLCTNFAKVKGHVVQIIVPPAPVALPFVDLAGVPDAEARARELVTKEAVRTFDLGRGPLVRFLLIRIRDNEHWLVRTCHHIIHDAWSWQVYFRELGLLYEARLRGDAPPLPHSEPLQYADYAAWQHKNFAPGSPPYEAEVQWWAAALSGAPRTLNLPFKRTYPLSGRDPDEGEMQLQLDARSAKLLNDLGRMQGATFFMVRLAALVALLTATVGTRDLTLGTYVSNRRRLALQSMFGYFINLVILRFHCNPESSFRAWLSIIRKCVADAESHGEIPYDVLQRELNRRGSRLPDVQAIFTVSRYLRRHNFGSLQITRIENPLSIMPWGFTFDIEQHSDEYDVMVSFDANLYDPNRVRAFVEQYSRLLDAAADNPDRSLGDLVKMSLRDRLY